MDFLLLLWFAFCFLPAWIAHEKGRPVGWVFLISLVASPIVGTIVALVLQRRDVLAPHSATHRRCPDCQEWILLSARKCKHCGSIFADGTPSMVRCAHCDRNSDAAHTHCDFCGCHLHAIG